jgi:hypothetical protein
MSENFRVYGEHLPMSSCVGFGGSSFFRCLQSFSATRQQQIRNKKKQQKKKNKQTNTLTKKNTHTHIICNEYENKIIIVFFFQSPDQPILSHVKFWRKSEHK